MRMDSKKILIAKLGLDGHDRGAKIIAKALMDHGYDVVYLGIHQTPRSVIEAAIQEDVKAVGISILSGSHLELINDLIELMKKRNLKIPVLVGGIIPPEDIQKLKEMGVYEVCGPGTSLKRIVKLFDEVLRND